MLILNSLSCPFTWRDAPDLIKRLITAQNHSAMVNRDILTFAGFMNSRAELESYVASKEALVADYTPAGRRRVRRAV